MLRNLFVRHTSDDVDRVGHGYGIHVDVDGGDDDDERNYHEHHHISEVGTIFLSFLNIFLELCIHQFLSCVHFI